MSQKVEFVLCLEFVSFHIYRYLFVYIWYFYFSFTLYCISTFYKEVNGIILISFGAMHTGKHLIIEDGGS